MLFIQSITLAFSLVSAAPVPGGGSTVVDFAENSAARLAAGNIQSARSFSGGLTGAAESPLQRSVSSPALFGTGETAASRLAAGNVRSAAAPGELTGAAESSIARAASFDSKALPGLATTLTAPERSTITTSQRAIFGPQTEFDALMEGRGLVLVNGKYDPLATFPPELTKAFPTMTLNQQKAVFVAWFERNGNSAAMQQEIAGLLTQAKVDSKNIKILTGVAVVAGATAIGTSIGLGFVANDNANLQTQLDIQSKINRA